jgi:hypothetical protein
VHEVLLAFIEVVEMQVANYGVPPREMATPAELDDGVRENPEIHPTGIRYIE